MESKKEYASEKLIRVIGTALERDITKVNYETKKMKGGTVGDVVLVYGTAITMNGEAIPYKVIHKTQRKWERFADNDSWRREYDLYTANLDDLFSEHFRWPRCYYAEDLDDEIQLWIEYIEGVSGLALTSAMYEHAALELGRFQGKITSHMPKELKSVKNLSKKDYIKKNYLHYRSWGEVYHYIRSNDCVIPEHLCKMLIDLDEHAEYTWAQIEQLPVVFSHRDFWVANIFCTDNKTLLIDWDTTGWGYLGEDIASLIADDADVSCMVDNYEKCTKAYYKGFSEYVDLEHIRNPYIKEMILFTFGYRLVESVKFADTAKEQALQIDVLNKIYAMGEITF